MVRSLVYMLRNSHIYEVLNYPLYLVGDGSLSDIYRECPFTALFLLWFIVFGIGIYKSVLDYQEEKKNVTNKSRLPDIETSIVDLVAVVMRADGKVTKSELIPVKRFLLRGFGEERARSLLAKLRDTLKEKQITDIRRQCLQVNQNLTYKQKLALLDLFFSIVAAEPLQSTEVKLLLLFAKYTRIDSDDFSMLRGRHFSFSAWQEPLREEKKQEEKKEEERVVSTNHLEEAYKVLGLSAGADMSQVKRAYRKLAMRWHPDRFVSSTESEIAHASSMFREVTQAYRKICDAAPVA